jgi:nondiscriminating glutamyl-tRNA synthetase
VAARLTDNRGVVGWDGEPRTDPNMPITTRFAPSPTGALHPGSLRTALFSWLFARGRSGRFLIRIEDTDAERSQQTAEASQLEDLAWMGLDPDADPVRQSDRALEHLRHLEALIEAGRVYRCFCTRERLDALRQQQTKAGEPPRYDGRCRELEAVERDALVAANTPSVWRLRTFGVGELTLHDLVRGEVVFPVADIGDFVLTREDGSPVFLFANAVDDADMGITHVLRGEDHLSNTPRQMLVLSALERPVPVYGHLPLVVDGAGQPLSKREASLAVGRLRADGILPRALANLLFRLGHHEGSGELMDLQQMAQRFDPARLGHASASFDPEQLAHWQGAALRALDPASYLEWARVCLGEAAPADDALLILLRANIHDGPSLSEAVDAMSGPLAPDPAARETLIQAGSSFLAQAQEYLPEDGDGFGAWLDTLRTTTGHKGRALFMPIRAALTGRIDGPELARVFAYLGGARVRERLARAEEIARGAD